MLVSITLALVSLLVIALYSALDMALSNYNMLKVEIDKKQERGYAEIVNKLSQIRGEVISSFYIGRTLALLVLGLSVAMIFEPLFSHYLSLNRALVIVIEIVSVTILVLTAAVLFPFAVSTMRPNWVLENFYWFADISHRIFSPFVKRNAIIEERDVTPSEEITIFQNALNFPEVVLRNCMVPRTEICAIAEDASYDELLALFADSNYSRIIVYRENIDRIIGYIHSKDLFNGEKPIREMIREIDFLPETKSAQSLLAMLTKSKRSIAVVLDDYGGTAGIVTLEDLIEEIFGEISDELDKEELIEKKISDCEYIFSARLEIKYLNRTYDLMLPESDDYETLAGFITFFHESIPSEGEVLEHENYYFTILKTTSNRVEKVALRIEE